MMREMGKTATPTLGNWPVLLGVDAGRHYHK